MLARPHQGACFACMSTPVVLGRCTLQPASPWHRSSPHMHDALLRALACKPNRAMKPAHTACRPTPTAYKVARAACAAHTPMWCRRIALSRHMSLSCVCKPSDAQLAAVYWRRERASDAMKTVDGSTASSCSADADRTLSHELAVRARSAMTFFRRESSRRAADSDAQLAPVLWILK